MSDDDIYEVEKILAKRKRLNRIQYLVKWKGYPDSDNSWVNSSDVLDDDLIKVFEESQKKKKQKISKRKKTTVKSTVKKKATRSQPKRKTSKTHKQSSSDDDDEEDTFKEDEWSTEQLEQLQNAIATTSASDPNYWDTISQKVEGKTAKQCQERYQTHFKTPKKQATRKRKAESPVVFENLSEIKGKMTKKRKIRALLQHADKQHKDDVFESTPMKKEAKEHNLDISFESDFGLPNFDKIITPSKDSENKATNEEENKTSPGILRPVEMSELDTYVNKFKQGKKLPTEGPRVKRKRKPKKMVKEETKKNEEQTKSIDKTIYENVAILESPLSEDSSESDDYYFSCEES